MPDRDQLLQRLHRGAAAISIDLDDTQAAALIDYLALMIKWNRAFNLSAIRDPLEAVDKHLVDSLALLPLIETGKHYLDIGAGAGLPGIPLAIMSPQTQFTLVDGNGKKTRFIQQAIMTLKLYNAAVLHSRIEALPALEFDVVTARALGTLQQMTQWLGTRLHGSRYLLAMKGVYPDAEIAELSSDFEVTQIQRLHIPTIDAERHAVWVRPAPAQQG